MSETDYANYSYCANCSHTRVIRTGWLLTFIVCEISQYTLLTNNILSFQVEGKSVTWTFGFRFFPLPQYGNRCWSSFWEGSFHSLQSMRILLCAFNTRYIEINRFNPIWTIPITLSTLYIGDQSHKDYASFPASESVYMLAVGYKMTFLYYCLNNQIYIFTDKTPKWAHPPEKWRR